MKHSSIGVSNTLDHLVAAYNAAKSRRDAPDTRTSDIMRHYWQGECNGIMAAINVIHDMAGSSTAEYMLTFDR